MQTWNTPHGDPTIVWYDGAASEFASCTWNFRPERALHGFARYVQPHAAVLDAGTGPGRSPGTTYWH